MSEMRVRRAAIAEVAKSRPPGYEAAVLAAAVRSDHTFVWLTNQTYLALRAKYATAPVDGPSLLEKAKNFATASAQHIAAGMPMASEEEIERRFAICQTCPFLKDSVCSKCGCPVKRERKFLSKLAWADQKCPEGHW